jgi:hypothetical protein
MTGCRAFMAGVSAATAAGALLFLLGAIIEVIFAA